MPTLSGIYTSLTGQTLAVDEHCHLRVIHGDQPKTKLRADAEFWLCEDDGKIGKFGSPKKVTLHLQGQNYHIWVEPRGFSDGGYEASSSNSIRIKFPCGLPSHRHYAPRNASS
ncbi:hypothetical protein BO86DRAFT_361747 [Aspergillus japonicus CBS 114.51]|uniref:Uncharacterized protein n=1 Tax=Aspergillus japonicus CBS 114.51 TaxID=1448312 RepID=A0A8T8X1L1_ASPJA|nr:hypothetical protein BO86DRAFT_361747 [Aspergillus japonicus CBS 114.51]RAH82037.1 hypothetical protein BO86DRAFT_361747 [Aspergillus japonicus CBS 114.51]